MQKKTEEIHITNIKCVKTLVFQSINRNFALLKPDYMKLANLAKRNYKEPGRIAYNAAMYIAVEEHQGKEMLVCRPHPDFLDNEAFMAIFCQQDKVTESYTHPRILRYLEYSSDERGAFWYMTPGKYSSLAQLMVDKNQIRLNEKWVDDSITELLEAVEYANSQGHYLLELTPHSVMATKDAYNHIMLMPPLSEFLPLKNLIYSTSDERIAPELFNIEEPDQHADIYGVGRIIEFLHPYPSLPYKYNAVVKSAVFERVDKRPKNATAMLNTISKRRTGGNITNVIISVAVVLGLAALLIFFPWGDDNHRDIKQLNGPDTTLFDDGVLMGSTSLDPLVNTSIESASEAEKARMLDDYIHDSTYMSMDTAVSLSPEMKEYQRQMMIMASEKFRAQFKQQARPILQKVYTEENMSSQEKFMEASREANLHLLEIQEALTSQYQIDPTTATRIAGEVYDEVVDAVK